MSRNALLTLATLLTLSQASALAHGYNEFNPAGRDTFQASIDSQPEWQSNGHLNRARHNQQRANRNPARERWNDQRLYQSQQRNHQADERLNTARRDDIGQDSHRRRSDH